MQRRAAQTFLVASFAAVAFTTAATQAQAEYPNKPVRVVVNFTPGGPLNILARALAESLQRS